MGFEDKDYIIDKNSGERIEIKRISSTERKKWVNKFSKKITPILASTLLASNVSATDIDISKLPHYAGLDGWLKKHVKISVSRGRTSTDWSDKYNTDYYERYNSQVKNIENTDLVGVENLNVVGGKMYLDGRGYNLVSARNIVPDEDIIKYNDLDNVIIRINGTAFKSTPKFLRLDFQRRGKKGGFGYQEDKMVTLVYVSYLNKIKVLGYIDNYAGFIETTPKDYEISAKIESKRRIYENISEILGCNGNCRYKKNMSGDIYFYSGNRFIGQIQDMGDKKFILKGNRVVAKLIERGDKILLIDNNNNILYRSNGTKNIQISIPEVDMKIGLSIRNIIT